jgi:hypothetical protein
MATARSLVPKIGYDHKSITITIYSSDSCPLQSICCLFNFVWYDPLQASDLRMGKGELPGPPVRLSGRCYGYQWLQRIIE